MPVRERLVNRRKEMGRGKGFAARTEPIRPGPALNRGGGFGPRVQGLAPGGPIERTRNDWGAADKRAPKPDPAPRAKAARKTKPDGRIPDAVRRIVLARAGGLCEACGGQLPEQGVHLHHRLRKAQRVLHTPANLIALHPLCHVLAAHAVHQRPAWARKCGYLLRSGQIPGEVPILLHGIQEVFLDGPDPYLYEVPPEDWWQPVPA